MSTPLEDVAGWGDELNSAEPIEQSAHTGANGFRAFNIAEWIAKHSLKIRRGPIAWEGGGQKWELEVCPFDPAHVGGCAVITQRATGQLGFKCQHNSCAENHWRQLRELLDGPRGHAKPGSDTSAVASFSWIGGEELSRMNVQPPKMIIEKILPAGALAVICAKSKSGKTTLIAEFCEAICTGRPALGHYTVIPGPVLYWLADDSNVTRFARAWRELTGDSPVKNFHLSVARQPLYPDGLINLEKAIKEFKPVFVCVDSYTQVRSPTAPKPISSKPNTWTCAGYLNSPRPVAQQWH